MWNRSGGIGRRCVTAVGWLGMGEGRTVRAVLGVVGQGLGSGYGGGLLVRGGGGWQDGKSLAVSECHQWPPTSSIYAPTRIKAAYSWVAGTRPEYRRESICQRNVW